LAERDRRWHEYRDHLKHGRVPSGVAYEAPNALRQRVLSVLKRYQNHNKVTVVSHFNVLESLTGYQENGIGCAEFMMLTLSDVV
jgi:broad specificity phosphatase PhoE